MIKHFKMNQAQAAATITPPDANTWAQAKGPLKEYYNSHGRGTIVAMRNLFSHELS